MDIVTCRAGQLNCLHTSARAAQVHGGIGFIWEHNLQLYYKRAKASEIMFGDANYHCEEIARKVVDGDED